MPAALFALQVLNQILATVPMAAAVYTSFSARRGVLEQMVAANRDPTPAEWQELMQSLEAASAQLMAVKP